MAIAGMKNLSAVHFCLLFMPGSLTHSALGWAQILLVAEGEDNTHKSSTR